MKINKEIRKLRFTCKKRKKQERQQTCFFQDKIKSSRINCYWINEQQETNEENNQKNAIKWEDLNFVDNEWNRC